ncbi:uncharacterized protein QC763_505050 [Podospora pseudopauciseta]|uniref:Uncharacterized protein n=2 Tax=Podospora TaxID=5144 RepID=A0ABR0H921_9PEZI|nr:hypothetical protein QC763_505050 [Podospora pseudopauciseta]KAK4675537.1 hypothetical protein QC764_505050 [Podospora pseudoanserina]
MEGCKIHSDPETVTDKCGQCSECLITIHQRWFCKIPIQMLYTSFGGCNELEMTCRTFRGLEICMMSEPVQHAVMIVSEVHQPFGNSSRLFTPYPPYPRWYHDS